MRLEWPDHALLATLPAPHRCLSSAVLGGGLTTRAALAQPPGRRTTTRAPTRTCTWPRSPRANGAGPGRGHRHAHGRRRARRRAPRPGAGERRGHRRHRPAARRGGPAPAPAAARRDHQRLRRRPPRAERRRARRPPCRRRPRPRPRRWPTRGVRALNHHGPATGTATDAICVATPPGRARSPSPARPPRSAPPSRTRSTARCCRARASTGARWPRGGAWREATAARPRARPVARGRPRRRPARLAARRRRPRRARHRHRRAPRRPPLPSRPGRRRAARTRARGRAPRAVGRAVAAVALRRRALDRDPRARARAGRARARAPGPALRAARPGLPGPEGRRACSRRRSACACAASRRPRGPRSSGRRDDPGHRPLLDRLRDPEPVAHGARRGPRRRVGQLLPPRRAARRARHPRGGRARWRGCASAGPTSGPVRPGLERAGWAQRRPLADVVHARALAGGRRAARPAPMPDAAARIAARDRADLPGQAGRQPRARWRTWSSAGARPPARRRRRRCAPRTCVCAADHGHAARGTSLFDGAVSGQVAAAAARGETAIGVLARAREETLVVADLGLRGPTPPGCVDRRCARGHRRLRRRARR